MIMMLHQNSIRKQHRKTSLQPRFPSTQTTSRHAAVNNHAWGANPPPLPPLFGVSLREEAMELGLHGKKALVTGASKGIGLACAEVLAEEGVDVVLVARTEADLETARAKIAGEHNVAVRTCALDLSDSRNIDTLAAECADTDILVN